VDEAGSTDPLEQRPVEALPPRDGVSDPAAEFLRTVRALVHGEQVPAPRPGSDSWQPPEHGTDAEPAAGWLPGRWEVEPAAGPRGRRRAEPSRPVVSPEAPRGEKSAKSSRWRRRGRTVEAAVQRGAPGAEVSMEERRREPDLPPVTRGTGPGGGSGDVPVDAAEDGRTTVVAEQPDAATSPRTRAGADRAARKERAARARAESREQALVDRAAALVAEAGAKAERDRLGTGAEDLDVGTPLLADESEGAPPAAPRRSERRAAKRASRDAARATREVAQERDRLERAAAEALAAEARAEREAEQRRAEAARDAAVAADARDRATREAEEEHARAARIAEEVAATIARLEAEATAAAEGRTAERQAKIERAAAKAESRVARVARRTSAASERASAKAERRLRRAAAKAQQRADRAAASAQARSKVAADHARRAAELEARAIGADPGGSDERRTERLADYIARVESQRFPHGSRTPGTRFGRRARAGLVAAVIVAAAVVPWVAPQVPDAISGILPGHGGKPVHVADPPVAPPAGAFVGPVGVDQLAGPYDGVRLQAAGWPREVQVDRLHVDSTVVPISGQSGSLLPPSDPQVLGWWKEGRPVGAEYGSAVITGHTVHTGGGALDHLDKLVVGDTVRVRTDAGWIRYVVQRTRVYPTEELARDAKQIFTLGGPGRLVLITCDDWNGSFYESNAVVFAVPVADEPS
jgi:LPXTG-site transpeptidase (sortase) family protein